MAIKQDAALKELKPHVSNFWNAVMRAGERYLQQPDLGAFCPRTRATTMNCLVCAELVSHFDEVPGVGAHDDLKNQMRYLSIGNGSIFVWAKKVNAQRKKSNLMLTDHARDLVSGQTAFDFVPKASLLVLGYLFGENFTLKRISFMPPALKKPKWFIDVTRADSKVLEMGRRIQLPRAQRQSGLVITMGPMQAEI